MGDPFIYGKVQRAALVEWLEKRGDRPAFFFPDGASTGKPLGTTERETLLGLIAVLAEAAGLDLREETKGHAEARKIQGWASFRQCNLSSETIAKKLVAAREVIFPRGPEGHSN
jgi:hypothetical protein